MRFNLLPRSMFKSICLLAAVAALAPAAFAQDSRRASRIDVEDYQIRAQINPETQSLTARVAVRFTPLDDQITSLIFELNNALSISRIMDGKGQQVTSSRSSADHSVSLNF